MKRIGSLGLLLMAFVMSSCEAIGDIFGAGVYSGIFITIFVIVLIVVIVMRLFRRR
jgi:hypothetical protein